MDESREQVEQAPTLSYGRRASGRRRWSRRAIILAILLVIAIAFHRWGMSWLRHVAMLQARWQCARYTAPPDLVVYDEHPDSVPLLLQNDADYVRLRLTENTKWRLQRTGLTTWHYGPAKNGIAARRAPKVLRTTG